MTEIVLTSRFRTAFKRKVRGNKNLEVRFRVTEIKKAKNVDIQLMINEKFHAAFVELKKYAAKTSEELKSPVLRLLQVEGWLEKHISKTRIKEAT